MREYKFAFIIKGNFDVTVDHAVIANGSGQMIGVRTVDEAVEVAKRLQQEGVDCIELCGGFGEAGARRIMDATDNKMPVGFITHLPEMDPVYKEVFGK